MVKGYLIQKYLESHTRHIIIIFLVAFLVRLFLVWYLLGLDWQYNTGDGYENAAFLKHILEASCYMPPGQYIFAGAINQFFAEPNYFLLRIVTIAVSSLVSINIYRIGKENFSKGIGLIAGYASIFSLPFIFQSWTFYPSTLATCLFSFFILYFFRSLKFPTNKNIILSSLFIGLAVLTRTEVFLVLPIACVWLLLVKGFKRDVFKIIAKLLIVFFLVIFSWTVRNCIVCNKFVFISSNGPINFFIGNNPVQTGGYSPPKTTYKEEEKYFFSGLKYDLEHPGWFVKFFKEKFKLYWSTRTWEHPMWLLINRFNNSTVKVFNDSFRDSRLNAILQNPKTYEPYEFFIFLYGALIVVFWFFILLGFLQGHLLWQKSYFLIGICCVNSIVFSLFFSDANRYILPMLPYLYIIMAMGIVFLFKITSLKSKEIKTLLYRNAFVLLILGVSYLLSSLLIFSPEVKKEKIHKLYRWNILQRGEESISLIILESQLTYPINRSAKNKESFRVWFDEKEIPFRGKSDKEITGENFYFLKTKNLLCKVAFIVDLPISIVDKSFDTKKLRVELTPLKRVISVLEGKIIVQYIPEWQFHDWIENSFHFFLKSFVNIPNSPST